MIVTAAFVAWALAGILVHVLLYINAKRKFAQLDIHAANNQEGSIRPGLGTNTAMSMVSNIVSFIIMLFGRCRVGSSTGFYSLEKEMTDVLSFFFL
jgi:hypothetical protein